MNVLVFEWLCGGGLWLDQQPWEPADSMMTQGLGMLLAVTADFRRLGCQVLVPLDPRVARDDRWQQAAQGLQIQPVRSASQPASELARLAADADAILLIAPETGGRLLQALDWIAPHADRLISPSRGWVELTGDKNRLAARLLESGFTALPKGMPLDRYFQLPPADRPDWNPAVLKPADGAGSDAVQLLDPQDPDAADRLAASVTRGDAAHWRLESFVRGRPVSISAIGNGRDWTFLPATGQVFDAEPWGHYLGPDLNLPQTLACRARQLAEDALGHLPPTQGYVGLDLVLADEPQADCLIEINPRLTMSYPQLSQQAPDNLAAVMLQSLS